MLGLRIDDHRTCSCGEGDGEFVSSVIRLTGAWRGTVGIRTTRTFAELAACRMLAMNSGDLGSKDVCDTLAELANVLGGNLQRVLPPPTQLSLPEVMTGRGCARPYDPADKGVLQLDLTSAGHVLCVSIAARESR